MKTYLILAEIELNIGDEYYRHVSDVFVTSVKAESEDSAKSQSPVQYNDEWQEGKVQHIRVQELV